MNIYTHRDVNIRKTWLLFTLFLVVVIGLGYLTSWYFNGPAILVAAVVLSVLMSVISYWYSDKIVLGMAGAQPVNRENARELYAIVENLAITGGLPIPRVYIINDPSPNAFATGRSPKRAVVAVTTGLLDRLDRSELEGVIAHELSHIGNWDMLVSTVVVVLVGFISLLSDFFLRAAWWGRMGGDDNRGGNGLAFAVALILFILAPIAAALVQLAISRRREFLADASGALLTRYPEGLANALRKISQAPAVRTAANTTAHLWFDDPFGPRRHTPWWHKLFMTHPPIEERIAALLGR